MAATWRLSQRCTGATPPRVAELAARYGVERTSTTLEELIDAPDVSVVDNCLSNNLHFGPLMRAIEAGKHVFSEKPLTIELGEAVQLLAAARAAGVQHGVIQNMRFNTGPATRARVDRRTGWSVACSAPTSCSATWCRGRS